jgi:hypothetical protein
LTGEFRQRVLGERKNKGGGVPYVYLLVINISRVKKKGGETYLEVVVIEDEDEDKFKSSEDAT